MPCLSQSLRKCASSTEPTTTAAGSLYPSRAPTSYLALSLFKNQRRLGRRRFLCSSFGVLSLIQKGRGPAFSLGCFSLSYHGTRVPHPCVFCKRGRRCGLPRYYGADPLHFIACSCYCRMPLLGPAGSRDRILHVLEQTSPVPTRLGSSLHSIPALKPSTPSRQNRACWEPRRGARLGRPSEAYVLLFGACVLM